VIALGEIDANHISARTSAPYAEAPEFSNEIRIKEPK
jgi:hypothetical protein